MRAQDLIRQKRDGREATPEDLRAFIGGVVDGSIPDYQIAALLMAIFIRGMSDAELSAWTEAMIASGTVVDLSNIQGQKVDKHSTGGVGDKVSICLAPLVAACGVSVPMISGRGLGHTGGTLDKLETIPGFNTRLDIASFIDIVRCAGLALIGQTDDLAPADRKLYALRDVTGTVESIPLIASSIMSKKIAEGIDALVLDVKVGSGAFMKDLDRARLLAQTLIGIGERAGKRVTAFLTDMSQPLGQEVGNANEMREAIDILRGGGPQDLWDLTQRLAAEMLCLGGAATNEQEALAKVEQARRDGRGLSRLRLCVEMQGGDPRVIDNPGLLPTAPCHRDLLAEDSGYLASVDTEQVGVAAMVLGAGRRRVDDRIDPAVGLTFHARLGHEVRRGDRIAVIHHNDEERAREAERILRAAFCWTASPAPAPSLVYGVLR